MVKRHIYELNTITIVCRDSCRCKGNIKGNTAIMESTRGQSKYLLGGNPNMEHYFSCLSINVITVKSRFTDNIDEKHKYCEHLDMKKYYGD